MSALLPRTGAARPAARRRLPSGPIGRTVLRGTVPLAGAALLLSGCAVGGSSGDRPHIVVTTNILGDVVGEVVGDAADVTTLMRPNSDPHSFEISAQEAAQLADADLLVSNGLGLEEGVEQHLETAAAAGANRFVAGEHIVVIDYSSDDASGPDPHFWTDPERIVDVVHALETVLVDIDGIDASAVQDGAGAYLAEIEVLDAEMNEAFATIPEARRALVTNHHVFGYLADRFDFELVGAVIPGGTTLASPSAADLDSLATAIDTTGVPAIFAESSQPDRLMQVLASEVGIDVQVIELFTESLSEADEAAPTYLDMMRVNTQRITQGLTGTSP